MCVYHCNCIQLLYTKHRTVLVIFPLILQTIIIHHSSDNVNWRREGGGSDTSSSSTFSSVKDNSPWTPYLYISLRRLTAGTFSVVIPGQEKDDESGDSGGGRNEITDVEADLLLNVDDQQVGNTAASVDEPPEPVEERVNSLLAEPLHLQQHECCLVTLHTDK